MTTDQTHCLGCDSLSCKDCFEVHAREQGYTRAQASAPEGGEAVAYYCTKLRDRYGDDDKITGEKWLEGQVTMDRNEAHMLEHDFGWTAQALYTRSNAKAGEVELYGDFAECYLTDAALEALRDPEIGIACVSRVKTPRAKTPLFLHQVTRRGDGSEMGDGNG